MFTAGLILAVLLGLIPAAIAQAKGRGFVGWWLYGAALFIVALPHALIIGRDQRAIDARAVQAGDGRKCPDCAEVVKAEAAKCRFCGHVFAGAAKAPASPFSYE